MQKGGDEYLNNLQDQRQQPSQMRDFQGADVQNRHQPPPSQTQKCPRCDSSYTKFCYYNNYSLSQPRYFCKDCRRYWTHGGTLRNVPIGGGCRKSKRSKPSSLSSPDSEMARSRIQSLSPALPSQNLVSNEIISGQSLLRAPPPVNIPPLGNISFYTGGNVLPSLAAMQSLPIGINQVAAPMRFGGGGGGGQLSGNMTLIRGMGIESLKHLAPQQIQAQNEHFQSQQSLILQRPLSSWAQSSINGGVTVTSARSSGFWSGAATSGNATDGCDQAGSSLHPNQWSDNNPGCDPPNQ